MESAGAEHGKLLRAEAKLVSKIRTCIYKIYCFCYSVNLLVKSPSTEVKPMQMFFQAWHFL